MSKQRAKVIKSISYSIADNHAELFYDPLANIAVICDTQKGCVHPFFLNLYKNRHYKGKTIQLDADMNMNQGQGDEDDVQGSKAQSSMNATASIAGGTSLSASTTNSKTSFSQRAMNYFKGTTQTFTNIQVAPGVYNKNLKMFTSRPDEDEGFISEDKKNKGMPSGLNDKVNKHQLMVCSVYNKTVMLHLSPQTGEIFIYELDPNMTFKYSQSIQIQRGSCVHQLQIFDNLLAVHNFDQKSTNLYDIKLAEYNLPVCADNLDIDISYLEDTYHSDKIFSEEHLDDDDKGESAEGTAFKSPSEAIQGKTIKQNKEFIEINF